MFPQLKSKKFFDISSGKVVNVIDQFENIAILDDKTRIDVKRLLDKSFYDEYIDPKEFFNQQNYQIFTEKIKSIPDEVIQKMEGNDESLIMEYDPEEEKRALLEKARTMNPINDIQNQIDKFKDLMDETPPIIINDVDVNPDRPIIQSQPTQTFTQPTQPLTVPIMEQPKLEDPMIIMFKNAKRNTDIKISLDIEDKIPKPEFIELMEDSYEVSIIDFLSEEFTKKILENPSIIKDKIKKEIENIVYKKVTKKPTPPETKIIKEGENPRRKTPTPPKDRVIKEGEQPSKPKTRKKLSS